MKKIMTQLLFIFLCVCGNAYASDWVGFTSFSYTGWDNDNSADTGRGYKNPIIPGFYPDASIVRVEDTYYLTHSTFAYFPGLPIFKSKNLVDWQQIGHALSSRSQLTFETQQDISHGIYAPTLRFHQGMFYIITTDVYGIGNFIISASNPAGPWSKPTLLREVGGIDPDLFFDDDGRVYIVHNDAPVEKPLYSGHRAIWLKELDWATKKIVPQSSRVIVNGGVNIKDKPNWIEGPHLIKKDGWYYLICAEGGTGDNHSEVVFRTRSLKEPFVPYENNPILTQRDLDPKRNNPITSTGHADFVTTPNGDWWAVFLGTRPYGAGYYNIGRETFLLPVTWRDDWPHILPAKTPVPHRVVAPSLGKFTSVPKAERFVWQDDFGSSALNFEWISARTTPEEFYRVDPKAHTVYLKPSATPLNTDGHASMLVRRQQHHNFEIFTQLQLPQQQGIQAGLVAFQSHAFNYFFGIEKVDEQYQFFVETTRDGNIERNLPIPLPNADATVTMGMAQEGDKLRFFYRNQQGVKVDIGNELDAALLSTQVAGGFVGATLGIHARTQASSKTKISSSLLAPIFQDNMVLQRNHSIRMWGKTDPGKRLGLTMANQTRYVIANHRGDWATVFSAFPEGGPYKLEITSEGRLLQTLKNLMVGDVWLCSGQSNMAWPVEKTTGTPPWANQPPPHVRLLTVARDSSPVELSEFRQASQWIEASPEQLQKFSAVCAYFAANLDQRLKVPLGLINASWGGSQIEAWMSTAALAQIHSLKPDLKLLQSYATDPATALRAYANNWQTWWQQHETSKPWAEAGTKPWQAVPKWTNWKTFGDDSLTHHDGLVWFAKEFTLTPAQAEQGARVILGGLAEIDLTWLNGEVLGTEFGWGTARSYNVPPLALKAGKNRLVVNVVSSYGDGGMTGPGVDVGLELQNGERISLESGWQYQAVPSTFGYPPNAPWQSINGLAGLYNAMIAPLQQLPVTGVLWYQGESNTGRANAYEELLWNLINDWRNRFGFSMQFITVQLPNYGQPAAEPTESGWAKVRHAQWLAGSKDPASGLVVTIDLGDPNDIHPTDKSVVGARAAKVAFAMLKRRTGMTDGIYPSDITLTDGNYVISFSPQNERLHIVGDQPLTYFELCSDHCVRVKAVLQNNQILINKDQLPQATKVRYCWADAPECLLYGESGLPVSSFELPM